MKKALDKCPLKGPLPDGNCQYVGRANRPGWGTLCAKHDYRLQTYGDPYATPIPLNEEPTYADIMARRKHGDLNRNIEY